MSFVFLPESFGGSAGDYVIIEEDNLKGLINSRGKILIPPQYEDMGWTSGSELVIDGIIGYKSDSKWGLISINNDQLTTAKYNTIELFVNDLIIASQKGSTGLIDYYGLINSRGKEIIPFKYISMKVAGNHIISVTKNDNDLLYGLIDRKDKIIVPFKYNKIKLLSSGIFSLKDKNEKIWFANQEGDLLVSDYFDELIDIRGNFIVVKKDGKIGLLNTEGNVLLDPVYKKINIDSLRNINALPFMEWTLIDSANNQISKLWYEEIEAVNRKIYKVSMNNGDAFIDKEGSLQGFPGNVNIVEYQEDYAIFKVKEKYGIMDFGGGIKIEPEYNEIIAANPFIFLRDNTSWSILESDDFSKLQGTYHDLNQLSKDYICMEMIS